MTPRAGLVLTPGAFYEQTWYRSTRRCHIPNIISLRHPVSEKKKIEDGLLYSYVGPVLTPGASYEKFGKGPQGDAIYQISKL